MEIVPVPLVPTCPTRWVYKAVESLCTVPGLHRERAKGDAPTIRDRRRPNLALSHLRYSGVFGSAPFALATPLVHRSPPLPLWTDLQLLCCQPGACALAALSSGQVQSSFGLIGEGIESWYDFFRYKVPILVKSSTAHYPKQQMCA